MICIQRTCSVHMGTLGEHARNGKENQHLSSASGVLGTPPGNRGEDMETRLSKVKPFSPDQTQ